MECIYCLKFRNNDLEIFARHLHNHHNNNLEVSYYEDNYEKNSICYECLALMFYGAWKYTEDGGDIRTFNLKSHLYSNYELFYYLAVMKYNMKKEKEQNIKNLNIIKDKFDEIGIIKMVESYF